PRCANRGTCARLRPASFAVLPDRGSPLSLSRHLAAVVLGACVLLAMAGPARAADNSHVLVLGRISDDPKAHYHQLKPLLDYLVPRMADVGITEGRVLMARDEQQMASYLRRGRVDWVTETAASGVLLSDRANAMPLVITERDGVRLYHSVFFARADSGIETLDDLGGRSIAFQRRNSTSAYFAPAAALLAAGHRLEILLSPLDKPEAPMVGYLFARSELNVSTWVHKRLVDAGVLSNLDWDNPGRMPPAFRKDMKVLFETDEYPRALELVRSDLDPKVQARLRELLLQAADDPDASEAMLSYFQTTRFLPIDEEA